MWKNGADLSEHGECVRVYEPIRYKFSGKVQSSLSVIGGIPCYFETDETVDRDHPQCQVCHEAMRLLAQLHIPSLPGAPNQFSVDRSIHVFSCNRAFCFRQLFQEGKGNFSLGGGGTVVCRRSQNGPKVEVPLPAVPLEVGETAQSPWSADAQPDDDDNDWGVEDDEETMGNVEAMLDDMEVSEGRKPLEKKKKLSKKPATNAVVDLNVPQFACYEVRAMQEPAGRKVDGDVDEDNVGISAGSDEKIQQMLARYMEEEDDEEILSALRGVGGSGGTEEDEKLLETDRAMLEFTDRVKRAPRQVIRYAKNGTPIWSIPKPKQGSQGKKAMDLKDPLKVPNCPCGAKRIFECQLMPSLLHVLQVDKHALAGQPGLVENHAGSALDLEFANGGQNWGTIAVFTCSESCGSYRDEFVIVQDAMDGLPELRCDTSMVVAVDMEDDSNDDDYCEEK